MKRTLRLVLGATLVLVGLHKICSESLLKEAEDYAFSY